jgi:serine/tyrosine/threonine adenylyltransferase
VHFNEAAADLVDLDPAAAATSEFVEVMAGNRRLERGDYLSMLYAGHQFGVYVPQLGDGRAILVGQVRNGRGESWDLQLKGAGQTPYSRFGDGRAVLRSTIREYLCGEAMHHLGIPTTRALCIVGSPQPVQRETIESAAVLCRMAPTHVRFGNFEVFYYRNQHDKLAPLADHVMAEHFPHLPAGAYAPFLTEVIERTADLIARWQLVGFCHGVMNTDNMSIVGLTLDYGPYGFLDGFDAHHICNHSDEGGRYAYDQQPMVGHWNCSRLVQATLPLLSENADEAVAIGTDLLERYAPRYTERVLQGWRRKLGLRDVRDEDPELINRFLSILHRGRSDFTQSFRRLAEVPTDSDEPTPMRDHIVDVAAFDAWIGDYRARLRAEQSDDAERAASMNAVNPSYVLRNHLVQAAIDRAQAGDFSEIDRLMKLLRRPFAEQTGMDAYAAGPPAGTVPVEVSCSS